MLVLAKISKRPCTDTGDLRAGVTVIHVPQGLCWAPLRALPEPYGCPALGSRASQG